MSSQEEKAPPAPAVAKPPSQLKLIVVGAVALFVALVGAQVAVPLINGMIAAGAHSAAAEDEEGAEDVVDEELAADEEEPADAEPSGPALYAALDPPFVVSFDEEGGSRFLQLTLQAMARDEETVAAIKLHAPAIRNTVLHKLSGYELPVLNTQAGKEQLRHELLDAANEILAKNKVEHGIEELYFTSLVVQ